MKKFVIGIICLIIGITAVSTMADTVQIDEDGKVYVTKEVSLRPLYAFETQAYENPGKEFPVWVTEKEKVGFLHFSYISTSTKALVFDGERIKSVDTEEVVKKGEPQLFLYKVQLLFAMVMMIGSFITWRRNYIRVTMIILFFATAASLFAGPNIVIANSNPVAAIAATLAGSASAVMIFIINEVTAKGDKKLPIILFSIFCIMNLVALFA